MRKYRLLKDTPYAKAGEICKVNHYEGKEIMTTMGGFTAMCADDLEHIRSYEEFDEWFEEVEDGDKPWEPEEGGIFYYINDEGDVYDSLWYGSNTATLNALNIGNCFRTEEEAEKSVEKLKALKRLRDHGFKFADYTIFSPLEIRIDTRIKSGTLFEDEITTEEVKHDLDLLFKEGDR